MIRISVIIPIFNHADYVIDCLSSILRQQDINFEIVAIDDGSIDDSYKLALEYLRKNLAPANWRLSTRENRGINSTLNEAINNSTGEIIYPLASDDRMPAGSFAQIRLAYSREKEKCKVFFYDVSLINWHGELVDGSSANARVGGASLLEYSKMHLVSQIALRWGSPFAHQFYPRDFYDKFGPYPENFKYEDLYFALKSISIDRFLFVPLPLKEYRLRLHQTATPGLNLSDLNQAGIRRLFQKPKKSRYYFILLIGYLHSNAQTTVSKFFFGKMCGLVQRVVGRWFLILAKINKNFI